MYLLRIETSLPSHGGTARNENGFRKQSFRARKNEEID